MAENVSNNIEQAIHQENIPKKRGKLQPYQEYNHNQCNNVKDLFLQDYILTANVYKTCTKLGISRTLVYNEWCQNDPEFKAKFDEVRRGHIEGIEGNMFSQALHDEKATLKQIFLLKKWLPERYGDDYNVNVKVEHQIDLTASALKTLKLANIASLPGASIEMLDESEPMQSQERVLSPKILRDADLGAEMGGPE